ncbi:MAG: heavy metal translocating P-type ATPase metal-binding domain-containing protein [Verrucomicrobiales bacterium]|nr:heavy metal translocating P-type ATPase metal-binding domain-containing protein [Verrucomicrobiota bacterium JB025]
MARCEHCGTEFSPKSETDRYCCKGCEYVAELIDEGGFSQFYDLKQGLAVAPVRSRPFEEHDFSWLDEKIAGAENHANSRGDAAKLELSLEGISCVGCVWLVEKLFGRHEGSVRAVSNPSTGRLFLEWIPGKCDIAAFLRELCQYGYVAAPAGTGGTDHERRRLAARLGLCAAFALNTMLFSLPGYFGMPDTFEFSSLFRLITFISATLSMLVGGGYFIDRAWRAIRTGTLHIDLPIALGLISAYTGSVVGWALGRDTMLYFDFVSIFVFLMLGGRYLQTTAVERNRRRLIRQQPVPDAVQNAEQPETTTPRDNIHPGLHFLLKPGNALPVSGVLHHGEADFSLEWIHGEADPVRFSSGSHLPAGAILLSKTPAEILASERWEDSLLAKLTANTDRERSSPGLERLLRGYLAAVLVLGLGTLAYWGIHGDWITGSQAMISIFVVSCPCALGVSIPLADDLAASTMERLGVFVRTATVWPRLRRVRHVIFDKTGTLTLERPVLENPEKLAGLSDAECLALARLTRNSLHPIARSLLEALGSRGQKLLHQHGNAETTESPGLGVSIHTPDGRWSLGKAGWNGTNRETQATAHGSELRHNGELVTTFTFRESLRPGAAETLDHLRHKHLTLHILSGDHPDKVSSMSKLLGIPDNQSFAGLSPEEKATMVAAIDHHNTLYLGDGANDSLAFDAAHVTGTPVVDRSLLESKADFYTLGSGLNFLPGLFATAAARTRAARSAFAFALIYNVLAVGYCMTGNMSPLIAAILMPLSSIASILIVATHSRIKIPNKG